MEQFYQLTSAQKATAEEIHTIIRNYKKDSEARKHSIAYFQERLRRLDEAWAQFESADNQIRLLENIPLEDDYFQNDLYTKILELVDVFRVQLETTMMKFKEPVPKQQPPPAKNTLPGAKSVISVPITTHIESETTSKQIGPILRKQRAMMSSLTRLLQSTAIFEAPDHGIQAISSLYDQIQLANFEIHELCDNPISEGYEFDKFIDIEAKVHEKLATLTNLTKDTATTAQARPEVRLPKISVPKFDGDLLKWQTFSDIFKRTIDEQPLRKIEKMWYLKTNLTGEAERLIRHLNLTEENYTTAWKILEERFNNIRVLTGSIIQKIMDLKTLTPEMRSIRDFHDTVHEGLLALQNLGIDTQQWDPLLLHILVRKLDRQSHILYESSLQNPRELQTIKQFLSFLEQRFQAFEAVGVKEKAKPTTSATATNTKTCKVCSKEGHPIYFCGKFLKMTTAERLKWTQAHKLCVNCFKENHRAKDCSSRSCSKCSKKHNTLLHLEKETSNTSTTKSSQRQNNATGTTTEEQQNIDSAIGTPATVATSKQLSSGRRYILLATAKVKITAINGRSCEFRALLDSGSQINIVTERLIKKLAITPSNSSLCIEGIGRRTRNASQRVNVKLNSINGNFTTRVEACILPQIVSPQPSCDIDVSGWIMPENIQLADPEFYKSEKIDVLLGAEFYNELLRPQQIKLKNQLPSLQNTKLGWIVTGKINEEYTNAVTCGIFSEDEATTSQILERFWKIDDADDHQRQMSATEKECENLFTQTVARTSDGRYIVQLPRLQNAAALGDSHQIALRRFYALEKRLCKDKDLERQYVSFMNEYEALGHMEEVNIKNLPTPNYFIPHHCVLKPESTTTKLRVVFDGSAKTSTGLSLNDVLHAGPTVQSELFSILLRFRMHRFVFTADIEKMYRQILVQAADQNLQLIIWRKNPAESIKYYRLTTVTYGTTSAPYLATRCLQHLAQTNITKYPIGAPILHDDFYVDDCLSGADVMSTALEAKTQLAVMLRQAGFNLRKWCANHPQLLSGANLDDQEINLDFHNEAIQAQKALGIMWLPKTDQLCGRTSLSLASNVPTKRSVCSDIGKIFDPLGLFGPVIVWAKIFTQQLWQLKISWDDELPKHLQQEWLRFQGDIQILNDLKSPRHVFNHKIVQRDQTQLHTFVDASEKAYGAAIYMRSITNDGTIIVNLLCAKSKVAPIKKQTLPRLELCAAVLGTELTQRVKRDLKRPDIATILWTDSEIVLAWINSSASSYYTFVANRVSKIQQMSCSKQWRHVSSKENPADLLSRGLAPKKMASCNLWFYGPLFLHGKESQWPQVYSEKCHISTDIEKRQIRTVALAKEQSGSDNLIQQINHKNSFKFLQRTVAYILRFATVIKGRPTTNVNQQTTLSPLELYTSLKFIVRAIQQSELSTDINNLRACKTINASSQLNGLAPFIDEDNILRVGGRLKAATISYDSKHPMVLPYNNPIARLLFVMKHEEHAHCGPQALLAIIRQQFWPIKGKISARNTVHNCIRCTRAKPKLMTQLMGNLPSDRVTASRPFFKAGVDYCGPFWVHYKGRGRRPYKAYLAIFCCFATKAVHLELVSDLTTEAFIGALKRFTGRRGRCKTLYSDNATNFVGTKNQLDELKTSIFSKTAQDAITKSSSDYGIEFKFIPPRAPHFGGLWEAAVKSAKHLLIKIVANMSFTYEEFETVIVEVEAILNSRPLTPLSSNPNDLTALTPGHFLIGEPLTAQVNPHAVPLKTTLAARWQLVTRIKEDFWKRWSSEYLHELQYRNKWQVKAQNIKEGDMVIIKDDNAPAMKWPLGRVVHVYKGDDNLVRVADIKTENGVFKRAVHRLAPLFSDNNVESTEHENQNISQISQKRQHSSDNNKSTLPKRKYSGPGILSTVIITLLLLPLVLANSVNITQFETNPGIYFESIGLTKLNSGSWKIIVYYDLNPLWSHNKILANGISTLKSLCNSSIDRSCGSLVHDLNQTANQLIQEKDLLAPTRSRRAALDIVGNIAHALFGVLDSNYAEEMSNTISNVQKNEQFLLNLIKNQTSIIDATINILKDDASTTKQHILELQDTIWEEFSKLENEGATLQRAQFIMSLAVQLNMLASHIQKIQAELINVLTHTNHGNISPTILTPQQLKRELNTIKGHLPAGRTLPTDDNDLLHLYKLMDIKGAVTKSHIIFEIIVPLVNYENFELFFLIPIPTWVNNTMIIINTKAQYLGVSHHRDQYVILSTNEFEKCTTITDDLYMCSNLQATIGKNSGSYSCEIALFNNRTSPNCNIEHSYNNMSLISTRQPNRWIFATKTTTELTAVCDHNIQELQIQSSGLISISPGCIIKGGFLIIQGREEISTTIHAAFPSFGNLSSIGKPAEVERIFNLNTIHFNNKLEQLTILQKQLQHDIELPTQSHPSVIHQFSSYSALLLILLAAFSYVIWRIKKRCQQKRLSIESVPMPAPRHHCTNHDVAVEVD